MKSILLACLVAVGCVPGAGATAQFPAAQDDAPAAQNDAPAVDDSPRFVTPVDGSGNGPELGIPLGGNLYLPTSGDGMPFVGI